jgi:hypothetical protein
MPASTLVMVSAVLGAVNALRLRLRPRVPRGLAGIDRASAQRKPMQWRAGRHRVDQLRFRTLIAALAVLQLRPEHLSVRLPIVAT